MFPTAGDIETWPYHINAPEYKILLNNKKKYDMTVNGESIKGETVMSRLVCSDIMAFNE